MNLRAVRGMKDILPEDAVHWRWLEAQFRTIAERYGFGEVRTPILEATELFVREIGEGTDVVEKEMYSFERHDDRLTVRPEGTAGAARAYVQHAVSGREPISRWYYIGPMFRAERPAKGRFRQFHQAGCEIYGDPGPLCDAELIALCHEFVRAIGIEDTKIYVNSLGSGDLRARYRDALAAYFAPLKDQLSEDSQRRLEQNPLRILDSKSKADQALCADAPQVLDLLDDDDRAHFDELCRHLDTLEVPYVVEPRLVRGLDYYTRTLFELKTTRGDLGSQDTLIGGGRYDNMVKNLGHKTAVPAIGFAMGLERLLTLVDPPVEPPEPAVYLAPMLAAAQGPALALAQQLRRAGYRCEVDGRGNSLKSMLKRADKMNARLSVILGEEELAQGVVSLKDLARGEQEQVAMADLPAAVASRLAAETNGG